MRPRDERGVSGSVQWAVLTPLLLLTVLGIIQAGLVVHGRTIATHAAVAAAEEAAWLGASTGSAGALAQRLAADAGLADVQVDLQHAGGTVRVVVRGRMPSFVDVGQTHVSAQATRPVERVTQP